MPRNAQWTAEEDQELTKLAMANSEHNQGNIDWDEIHDKRTGQIARRSKNAMISRWWKIKEKQDYNLIDDDDGHHVDDDDDDEEQEDDDEEDEAQNNTQPVQSGEHKHNERQSHTVNYPHTEQMTATLYNGNTLSPNGPLLATRSNALNNSNNNNNTSSALPPHQTSVHLNSHSTVNGVGRGAATGDIHGDGKKKKKRKKKHSHSNSHRSKSKSASISNAASAVSTTHGQSQSIPLHFSHGTESMSNHHHASQPKHGNSSSSSSMQNIIHNLLTKKDTENDSNDANTMHGHSTRQKYNFMEDTSDEDEAGHAAPDDAELSGMNGKRRSNHRLRSKASSTDAMNKRVTRSATRKQKSLQNKKKDRNGIDLVSHKNYYRHDIQTLQLTSFELTQLKPYLKAFSDQVLLNEESLMRAQHGRGGGGGAVTVQHGDSNNNNNGNTATAGNDSNANDGSSVHEHEKALLEQVNAQNGNLRKTIVLQNKFLTELYTKVQHQQGIAREMVEKMDKLKEQNTWIKHEYKEYKKRAETVQFDKDLCLKQMMEKDGMLSALRNELNAIKAQYAQQLSDAQQQIQQQLQAQLESAHKEWTNAYSQANTEVETAKTALIATQTTLQQMQSVYVEHTNALIKVLNMAVPQKMDLIPRHHETIQSIQQIEHINQVNQTSLNHFAKIIQFLYDLVQIFKIDGSANNNNNSNGNSNHKMDINEMIDALQSKLYAALKPTVYASHIEQFEKQKKQQAQKQQKQKSKSSSPKQMESSTKTKQRKRKRPVTSSHNSGNEMKLNDNTNPNNNNNSNLVNANENNTGNGTNDPNPRKKRKKNDLSLPMINGNSANNNVMQPSQSPQHVHAGSKQPSPQRQPPPPIFTPINTNNSNNNSAVNSNNATPIPSSTTLVNANCANNNTAPNNSNPNNNGNNNNAFTLQASDANWLTTINSNANHQAFMAQAQPFQTQFSLTGATLSGQYQPLMLQTAAQQQQQQLHQQQQLQLQQHQHQQQSVQTQQQATQQHTGNNVQNTNNHARQNNNDKNNNILPPSLSAHVPPPLPAASSANRNQTTVPLPPRPPPPKLPNKPPKMTSMDRTSSAPTSDSNRKNKKHSLNRSVSSCSSNRANYKAGIELLLHVALNDPEQQQNPKSNDRK